MTIPIDGMIITQDTVFDPGVYYLPNGITIAADGVTLHGNGALLTGANRTGRGIVVRGRQGRIQPSSAGQPVTPCEPIFSGITGWLSKPCIPIARSSRIISSKATLSVISLKFRR